MQQSSQVWPEVQSSWRVSKGNQCCALLPSNLGIGLQTGSIFDRSCASIIKRCRNKRPGETARAIKPAMEFQVDTDNRLPKIRAARSAIAF